MNCLSCAKHDSTPAAADKADMSLQYLVWKTVELPNGKVSVQPSCAVVLASSMSALAFTRDIASLTENGTFKCIM